MLDPFELENGELEEDVVKALLELAVFTAQTDPRTKELVKALKRAAKEIVGPDRTLRGL